MNFQPLQYIYKPSGKPGAYTLLLLHGTGGNEEDLLPLAGYFGKDLNVLSLRGNVSEQGMPRFFKRLGMGVFDEQDLDFRTRELVAFLDELATKEGFDATKLIALGYSNGANIAGSTLFLFPELLAGAILFRPMQPFKALPALKGKPRTAVFTSNGLQDPTIDPGDTRKYLEQLQEAGFVTEHHLLNAGHNLSREDLELAVAWLQHAFEHGKL